MKCQSQLASLQLICKSWWQRRLPSLLNWQVPKEAHLRGITPPLLFAFFWVTRNSPGGNKFQLIYFLLRAFSTLPSLKASSNNSKYTHRETRVPNIDISVQKASHCRCQAESCWQMLQHKPPKNFQVWQQNSLFPIHTALMLGSK